MKSKKIIYTTLDDVESFDFKQLEKYHIKLSIKGPSEGFKVFRRGAFYAKLIKAGVKMTYSPIVAERAEVGRHTRDDISYKDVLREIVSAKSDAVKEVYAHVLGEDVGEEVGDEDADESVSADDDGDEDDEPGCEIVFDFD